MPVVSIILPTYNRGSTIGRAIDSVFSQGIDDFEIIVIDNGSTDNTPSIVKGFLDERIQYYYFEKKTGPGAARNFGLSKAKGKYIAFLDSDDQWLNTKLSKQLAVLDDSDENTCLVYTDMWWQFIKGDKLYHHSPDIVSGLILDSRNSFYQVYNIGIQSCLIRRERLESVRGFREDLGCFEDMELLLRLSMECDFVHLREPLVNYYESKGSVSKQTIEEIKVRARLLQLFKKDLFVFKKFYVKEKIIIALCKYLDLAGYFTRSNNQSFFEWIKKNDSPYILRFQKMWIKLTNALFENTLVKFHQGFTVIDKIDGITEIDSITVLAPPNDNRLEKAFNLYDSKRTEKLSFFRNSPELIFGEATNVSNRKRTEEMLEVGTMALLSHPQNMCPSTLTEIKKLYEIYRKEQRVIIVTDDFHTKRTRMIVDEIFGTSADRIRILAAENKRLQKNNWWHTLSGIRTYRREWLKLIYYKYYLLRKI